MNQNFKFLFAIAIPFLIYACSEDRTPEKKVNTKKNITTKKVGIVDPSLFLDGALIGSAETVECTLSGGTHTTCYRLTIAGAPADKDTSPEGPYCPPHIDSTADEGGTWIDGKGTL